MIRPQNLSAKWQKGPTNGAEGCSPSEELERPANRATFPVQKVLKVILKNIQSEIYLKAAIQTQMRGCYQMESFLIKPTHAGIC